MTLQSQINHRKKNQKKYTELSKFRYFVRRIIAEDLPQESISLKTEWWRNTKRSVNFQSWVVGNYSDCYWSKISY